jgi:hypothetical protein
MSEARIDLDADDLGRGLGRLVVALLDTVRQVLERQALRRLDAGSLSPDEIERLGQALLALEARFAELRRTLGVPEDPPVLTLDPMEGGEHAGTDDQREPRAQTE